jgi:DNA-binding transcriptional regulator YiaG
VLICSMMTSTEFRQIRAYLEMSHRALAGQLNVTAAAVARWESGAERVPNLVALLMNALQRQKRQRRRAS